jgi:hypothetical protein
LERDCAHGKTDFGSIFRRFGLIAVVVNSSGRPPTK